MNLRTIGRNGVDWINLAQGRVQWKFLLNTMSLVVGNFEQMSNWQFLKTVQLRPGSSGMRLWIGFVWFEGEICGWFL
jgi:hypothetical protein